MGGRLGGSGDELGERSALVNAVRVVRERWWLVALCFVVAVIVTVALSANSVKQYTATAKLLVHPSNLPALIEPTQVQNQDSTTLAREQSDYVSLLSSGAVAARVKQSLHSPQGIPDLQNRVNASAEANNDLIDISITDPVPAKAAGYANAYANGLVAYLNQSAQAQLIAGHARLQSELAQLPRSDPGRPALIQGLKQVIALEAVTNGGVQVVNPAQVPTSPSSPGLKRQAAIGGAAGIIIGVALAFLIDLFDRRLRTVEEIEELYGLPALASIPLRKARVGVRRDEQAELEPFRILRDGLAFVSLRDEARVVLVTSAVPSEGKTRIATGLARAIAFAGKSVALVEVDLRRPAALKELGLVPDGHGLTNALLDGTDPMQLLRTLDRLPFLSVLPAGPPTPNSAELLRSEAMTRILGYLADEHDYVILDGPPLLPVADAQTLLSNPMLDVCLIAARPFLTTRDQIRGALAILERHPELGMGLIVNAVREPASDYYYASHGRASSAGRSDPDAAPLAGQRPDSD